MAPNTTIRIHGHQRPCAAAAAAAAAAAGSLVNSNRVRSKLIFSRPVQEAWCEDEWALVGEGLDFVNEAESLSKYSVTVLGDRGPRGAEEDANRISLATSVFVAAGRHHRGSSQFHSQNQPLSQFFQHSVYGSSHHPPF